MESVQRNRRQVCVCVRERGGEEGVEEEGSAQATEQATGNNVYVTKGIGKGKAGRRRPSIDSAQAKRQGSRGCSLRRRKRSSSLTRERESGQEGRHQASGVCSRVALDLISTHASTHAVSSPLLLNDLPILVGGWTAGREPWSMWLVSSGLHRGHKDRPLLSVERTRC